MNIIKINVEGASKLPIDSLEPFQGDLKRLERDEYEKLRRNLIENGYSFTVHVWQDEGHNYIIDGHQRVFAMKQMREFENWEIPDLPVSFITAASFQDAKKLVLAGTSVYGTMTPDALANFMKDADLTFPDVAGTFTFPEISPELLMSKFEMPPIEQLPNVTDGSGNDMRSASGGVKQVQLFYDSATHEEFMSKIGAISAAMKRENISDTLMELVREKHSALEE